MTGNQLLEAALDLIAARGSDSLLPDSCADYKARALNIINICLAETAFINGVLLDTEPFIPHIDALTDDINLHPTVSYAVLPFGIASYLLLDEDSGLSDRLLSAYRRETDRAGRLCRGKRHPISEDPI